MPGTGLHLEDLEELAATPASGDELYISDAGIGKRVSVANLIAGADPVTYETLDSAGDVGTGSGQLAIGDHSHTLVEDDLVLGFGAQAAGVSNTYYMLAEDIAAGADLDLAAITRPYAAVSRAAGVALVNAYAETLNVLKVRLIMDGVQVAESGFIITSNTSAQSAVGTRALSGSVDSVCRVHNYGGSAAEFYSITRISPVRSAGFIFVGSIKI